jgi:diguanylate cyclase (GGDEF)-like protein
LLNQLFNNRKFVGLSIAIFLISSIAWVESFQLKQIKSMESLELGQAKREVASIRANLESLIYSEIFLTNTLSTHLLVDPNPKPTQLQLIIDEIFRQSNHIQGIGIAPDDVVKFIYPFNENVIGLDYRTVPEQWASIQQARSLETMLISGPINLVQGGRAFIGRSPVFLDPPQNTNYWGLVSVVIELETLLNDSGFQYFQSQYNIAIRGKDGKGHRGEHFYGDITAYADPFIIEEVTLPYGSWVIYASTPKGWSVNQPWHVIYNTRLLLYPAIMLLLVAFLTIYSLYKSAYVNSLHDELTGLPNRRYMMFTLEDLAEKSSRSKGVFAIFNIDLNKFKWVNDTYGHAAGDALLIETAIRLKRSLRATDIVSRLGGDEFLVLLPRVSQPGEIFNIISHLNYNLSKSPLIFKGQEIFISASIGYAIYDESINDIDELLHIADQNMYASKKQTAVTEHEDPLSVIAHNARKLR